MKNKLIMIFVSALLLMILILPGTVSAWSAVEKYIQVRYAQIQMSIDGEVIPTKAEPFIYNQDVYVPVAPIANALGIHWQWDNAIPSVNFLSKARQREEGQMSSKEFYDLGQEYYWHHDVGGSVTIWHGLRDFDKDATMIEIPSLDEESPYQPYFNLEITNFIDLNGDHQKNELLLRSYRDHEQNDHVEIRLHAIQLTDENKFILLDSILLQEAPNDELLSFHTIWNSAQNQLLVQHDDTENQTSVIDLYTMTDNKFELQQTFYSDKK